MISPQIVNVEISSRRLTKNTSPLVNQDILNLRSLKSKNIDILKYPVFKHPKNYKMPIGVRP